MPITELLARSPESVEFWRRTILEERGLQMAAMTKPERRELSIEAVQRRAAWFAGDLELIETTHPHTNGTEGNPCY